MGFNNKERASLAGRKSSRAGVANKSTAETREAFSLLLSNNLARLQQDLDSLEPKDRLKIILDLARFVVPQLQSVSIDDISQREEQSFNVITINLLKNGDDGEDNI